MTRRSGGAGFTYWNAIQNVSAISAIRGNATISASRVHQLRSRLARIARSRARDRRGMRSVSGRELDAAVAGLLVALELQVAALLRLLEHSVERPEAVIRLVEAGLAPLQRLL